MTEFDPARYLTKVGSADYLEVKWRLVWLRETHPEAELDTQLVSHPESGEAIFKCTIRLPGGGSASGWGSETPNDFRDYLEKAETKAIGRALAALGFGTQFTSDHEFGAANGKVVDTPVTRPLKRERQPVPIQERKPVPADAEPEQTALVDSGDAVHDWTAFWSLMRTKYHVMTRDEFVELVQRTPDQFNAPQHALNAVNKAIRERDAAIDKGRAAVTTT